MTAERHADAVRRYLDYLCRCPEPAKAVTWAEWVRRTAVVGLAFGVVACAGETEGDGQGGAPAAGGVSGIPITVTGGQAVLYGLRDGGLASGGRGTGGYGAATGGVLGTGGIGDLYGMPVGGIGSGGRGSGGVTAGGKPPIIGGAPGMSGTGTLYGIPVGGMPAADAGVDCNCPIGAYLPVCGADGQTHDAACGAQCVPVGIACLGPCPCDVDGGVSCNVACTVVPNSPYCDTARVSWMCKSGAPTTLMLGAGCQMEPTDSIRFCCASSFLSACH